MGFSIKWTGAALVSYIAGTFDSSGNALQGWGANDIIGFALDMDNGKLYVSINGVFKGLDNNSGDPANGTNPAITGIPTGGKFIIPYFEKSGADSPETMCNFGNGYFGTTAVSSNSGNGYSASGSLGIFQYDVPSGYTALCTKGLNLGEIMAYTTINKSLEHFNTLTWTGNGNATRSYTGVGFQPDLI